MPAPIDEATPPSSLPQKRGSWLAFLRCSVGFLAGLSITAAALAAFSPFPKLGNLWRKYHHLQEHGEKYSLVYLGSSRVFHEFIPKDFDAALAAKGHQIRSFNFGQDGMWPPESFYMLRQILEVKPKSVRWVLIDLMGIKASVEGNEATLRSVYWHDWEHTRMACRHVWEVDMEGQRTFAEKSSQILHHLDLWAQNVTSLGHGQEKLEVLLKLSRNKAPGKVPDEGFEVGGSGPLTGAMLTEFTASIEKLKTNPPPKPIQPVLRDALDRVVAEVRAAGAEPIFVVAAGNFAAERFTDWPPAGVQVLRFDDPLKYPDLYDPAHRYDPHHLDLTGARNFTRHLAEQFSAVLSSPR